jgi:hypothetical protein
MDVGGWLRSLGLEEYEAVIRQNKIDSEVLSELTESDLEKLGIPLGHAHAKSGPGTPESSGQSYLVSAHQSSADIPTVRRQFAFVP